MKAAHKLRVVPNCPAPEPPSYKPIQYGFAGGHKIDRLPSMPTAEEISIRARAQSILSKGGTRAELPDIETARRVIAEQSMPARAATAHDSPPVATVRAGSFPVDKRELPNMTPEQWDEWERAFGPEPNIPEEC